jgi:hypothetical protein
MRLATSVGYEKVAYEIVWHLKSSGATGVLTAELNSNDIRPAFRHHKNMIEAWYTLFSDDGELLGLEFRYCIDAPLRLNLIDNLWSKWRLSLKLT